MYYSVLQKYYTVLLRTSPYYKVLHSTIPYYKVLMHFDHFTVLPFYRFTLHTVLPFYRFILFTVLPFYPFYRFTLFTLLPFYPLTACLGRLDLLPFYRFTLLRCALVSENHRKQKAHREPPQQKIAFFSP